MKRTLFALSILAGALTLATAPAQIVYSFEPEDLHGFAGSAGDGWQVFRATTGVTHGDYSMGVQWPSTSGGFRWLFGNGVRDELLPYLQVSKKLLLDATVPAGVSVPWANVTFSLNGPDPYGWNQLIGAVGLPRVEGTRTILIDLESLPLPDPDTEWFQINFGMNAGASHQIYFDQLRLYRSDCEMVAMTFDSDVHGFAPDPNDLGVTVSWNDGKMRIQSTGGFHWIFNGTVPGLAAMVRRGALVVMDVTVVSPPPAGWGNMIISINSDTGGWGQSNYTAEVAAGNNTFTRTIAIDYRDASLPTDDNPAYCLLNLGINSGGPMTIEVDNIRIYRAQVAGDVNCDGCVDDADLLTVLFEFGSTAITPADVNSDGTVDDADLLEVLFNFGNGC
ncbi:MAG: dockerin type I domain-containing protein [Fimbriimonadales bacterium]|nr:MAG: hypothetical protein KatS3mg018_2082 [Fimbriimonadales bacterium]